MKRNLVVGQKIWCVIDRAPGYEVTVCKIGRKYAELSNRYRMCLDTWTLDGGKYTSPGQCYTDEAMYGRVMFRYTVWRIFYSAVISLRQLPNEVTELELLNMAEVLGGHVSAETRDKIKEKLGYEWKGRISKGGSKQGRRGEEKKND